MEKKMQPNLETNVKRKEKKKKKRIEKGDLDPTWKTKKKKKKKKKKKTTVLERAKGLTIGPLMCVFTKMSS